MSDRKLLDGKDVNLFPRSKNKSVSLKVSWLTHQGGKKRRGNPTVQYLLTP